MKILKENPVEVSKSPTASSDKTMMEKFKSLSMAKKISVIAIPIVAVAVIIYFVKRKK